MAIFQSDEDFQAYLQFLAEETGVNLLTSSLFTALPILFDK
jgi:hypothetical protein